MMHLQNQQLKKNMLIDSRCILSCPPPWNEYWHAKEILLSTVPLPTNVQWQAHAPCKIERLKRRPKMNLSRMVNRFKRFWVPIHQSCTASASSRRKPRPGKHTLLTDVTPLPSVAPAERVVARRSRANSSDGFSADSTEVMVRTLRERQQRSKRPTCTSGIVGLGRSKELEEGFMCISSGSCLIHHRNTNP